MKNLNEEIKKANGAEELEDEMLDGVSGGLIQIINPSSTPCYVFKDGTLCKHCGRWNGDYKNGRMICLDCKMDMVDRPVAGSEIKKTSTGRL